MPLSRLLSHWRAEPTIGANIAAWRSTPDRPPLLAAFPEDLPDPLRVVLQTNGIQALYAHQAQVWEATQHGRNVVIATGTASGKTLAYNLPVLSQLLHDPQVSALYLFPTKALAQDQLSGLQALLAALSGHYPALENRPRPLLSTYDGDTAPRLRPQIRKNARLVLTNPDMLHTGILPHHPNWAAFFRSLQYIVIDEIHIYRGVFGSHVANVIRRLMRIARHYSAEPHFILTSATIANPGELAGKLIAAPVELIDQDGAGRGPRHFLIYNPPLVDPDLGLRRSATHEAVRLAEDLLAYNQQTIVFGRSRRTVEILLTYLRDRAGAQATASTDSTGEPPAIRGYRSGYLPNERRSIERGLRSGQVRVVAATTALELGIDIGGLAAALIVGYPGSIAAARQQSGRAGRTREPALAVLVATADPLDQFLARHPEYLFERPPEAALINPDNLLILLAHIQCAAFELPFRVGDSFGSLPPDTLEELLVILTNNQVLHASQDRYFWMADRYPAQSISLRSASADSIVLQTVASGAATTIGAVDRASAAWMVHPGAIYLHEGQSYQVNQLDLSGGIAELSPVSVEYFTQPLRETQVDLIVRQEFSTVPGGERSHGEIQVTTQTVGYRKIRWHTHENLGYGELDLPPSELLTTAYWFSLDEQTLEALRNSGMWRDDSIDYGPNWADQRARARQRDNFRCQACGISEKGASHHVHHRTPFRVFQQQHGAQAYWYANRLDNLITLCPICHRRVETAVRVRGGLGGLAYIFGQLAPLYLMCAEHDLGVHHDPQAPIGAGQPSVILYEQIPAGIGFSARLYELHTELVRGALELVQSCACRDGCPSCIGPGGENGLGAKLETLAILKLMYGDSLPVA